MSTSYAHPFFADDPALASDVRPDVHPEIHHKHAGQAEIDHVPGPGWYWRMQGGPWQGPSGDLIEAIRAGHGGVRCASCESEAGLMWRAGWTRDQVNAYLAAKAQAARGAA